MIFYLVFNSFHEPYGYITQGVAGVNLEFKLPGIKEKDLILNINSRDIEVKAKSKSIKVRKNKGEFSETENYVRYHKKISLPSGLDINKAKAKFKKDTLYIKIPKQIVSRRKKVK